MNLITNLMNLKVFLKKYSPYASEYFFSTISLIDLIDKSKTKFSVIGITKSRFKTDTAPLKNINLQNYNIQHTPTESQQTSVKKLEMI